MNNRCFSEKSLLDIATPATLWTGNKLEEVEVIFVRDLKNLPDTNADNSNDKSAHWIAQDVKERDFDGSYSNYTEYKCSECGYCRAYTRACYCPSCGAEMKLEN